MEDEKKLKQIAERVEGLSNGVLGSEIQAASSKGLKIVEARKGFLRFHFVVPSHLLDEDGNWQAGAIATLIDDVGAYVVYSFDGLPNVSIEFTVSYFSTGNIHEGVEIVAKVVAEKGKLKSYTVEITRRSSGELIAVGRQWMTVRRQESKL